MKLYEINDEIRNISKQINDYAIENEGVIDQSLIEKLNDLKVTKDEKLIDIGILIKEMKVEMEGIKDEEKKLYNRRKVVENQIEFLKNYIMNNINYGQVIDSHRCKIGWRKSVSCVIDNEELIPNEFIKITKKPMIEELKNHLKEGFNIDGVHLEERNNLQIK